MKTSTKIELNFGEGDEAIKAAGTPSSTETHEVADIQDLKTDAADKKLLYATFEPNGWYLDGNTKLAPEPAHIGFVSQAISDAAGDFALTVVLLVSFTADHTVEQGVRFVFSEISGDYSSKLRVEYLNSVGAIVQTDTYFPTDYEFFAEPSVTPVTFREIRITFYSTNKPYRHLRLLEIGYDQLVFNNQNIQGASLVEQISPVSTELPFNTLEATLHSETGDFSITDPTSIYSELKQHQPVDVHETVDGTDVYMGRFYLDVWESLNVKKMKIDCIDAIGLMDTIPYLGGFWSNQTPNTPETIESEDLILEIMTAAGMEYELDTSLEGITLQGYVPPSSCREALQQVCFAIGAYATCTRSNKVQIRKTVMPKFVTPAFTITSAQKSIDHSLSLKPLVTGIDLSRHDYVRTLPKDTDGDFLYDTNVRVLFDGTIGTGLHRFYVAPDVAWDYNIVEITADLDYTEAITRTPTYLEFTILKGGTIRVEMEGYFKDVKYPYSVSLVTFDKENKVKVEQATIVTAANVGKIAHLVFDYLQNRYVQRMRLFADPVVQAGDVLSIVSQSSKYIQGIVERNTVDLSGGFTSTLEVVGVVSDATPAPIVSPAFHSGNKYDAGQTSHAGFVFFGTWSMAVVAQAYGGSIKYVGTGASGYVEFAFVGAQFKMVYTQLTDRGSVKVYVDNVLVATVSQNGATTYQKEWTSPVFSNSFHDVRIEHVETGGGAVTDLDAIEIL